MVDNFFLDIRRERTSQIIIIIEDTRNSVEISAPTDVTWKFFLLPECDRKLTPLSHTVASTRVRAKVRMCLNKWGVSL